MKNIVDFHSHILPGMDDGSASVAESIALLRMEAEQGIDHVVATPHFYPQKDTPERFLQRRAEAEAALREEMQKHTGLPKLSVGAEVFYFPGISDSEAMASLTVDRKRCILIEMPQPPWSDAVYREIQGLYTKRGLIPIIAHIDRYIGAFRTYGSPDRLAEYPVLVQANHLLPGHAPAEEEPDPPAGFGLPPDRQPKPQSGTGSGTDRKEAGRGPL